LAIFEKETERVDCRFPGGQVCGDVWQSVCVYKSGSKASAKPEEESERRWGMYVKRLAMLCLGMAISLGGCVTSRAIRVVDARTYRPRVREVRTHKVVKKRAKQERLTVKVDRRRTKTQVHRQTKAQNGEEKTKQEKARGQRRQRSSQRHKEDKEEKRKELSRTAGPFGKTTKVTKEKEPKIGDLKSQTGEETERRIRGRSGVGG